MTRRFVLKVNHSNSEFFAFGTCNCSLSGEQRGCYIVGGSTNLQRRALRCVTGDDLLVDIKIFELS